MMLFEKLMVLSAYIGAKRDERGATATEYALLVAGMVVIMATLFAVFGPALQAKFDGLLPTGG